MARKRIDVSDTELAILEVLWREGPATIRHITDRLYPEGTTAQYATVQSLLERLESKGCVTRDRGGFAHVFTAKTERATLIDQRLRVVAEKLCEGSLTPLLMHLAGAARLSAGDREILRRLLDESESQPRT